MKERAFYIIGRILFFSLVATTLIATWSDNYDFWIRVSITNSIALGFWWCTDKVFYNKS